MTDDSSKPWTEAQWEQFMRRSEIRAARYMELLETLSAEGDEIDHDEIAREMGWTGLSRDSDDNDDCDPACEAAFDPEDEFTEPDSFDMEVDAEERRQIPGYALAYDVGLEVMRTVQHMTDDEQGEQNGLPEEVNERLSSAVEHALIPAAKLAGGHAMGYDDEMLGGHIVCCKRAHESTITALEDVQWLTERGTIDATTGKHLTQRLSALQQTVEARLAELRARVWW